VFAAGAAAYLILFTGVPLVRGVWLSFTDTNLLAPNRGDFVGAENYTSLLTSRTFWHSLWTTVVYSGVTVVCSLVLGTVAAILINRQFPGRTLARAVLTFPWAVPTVAVYLVFRWIYNDQSGVLNRFTGALGLGQHGWLTDPEFGMFSVLLATVWKVTPFVMLVVLAALQSVPEELYEATRVDGADGLSTFKAVVLPYLMPTLRVVALLMTIWSFRRFEIIWLLTGGGPVDATNTLVINIYREAFNNSELGRAAAIGVLGLVLSLAVTLVYFVLEQRSAQKEGTR
jgi:multiple sugar transport system permease protein